MNRALRLLSIAKCFSRQPKLLPRCLLNLVLARGLRRRLLRNVEIAMSYDCNAACNHCCATDVAVSDRAILSQEAVVDVIDQSVAAGALSITVMGGEPLINDRLVTTVQHIRKRNAAAIVVTNGLALSESLMRQLCHAGIFCMTFSLFDLGEGHDAFVGVPGAFESVCRGLCLATKHKVVARIAATPTNASIGSGRFRKLIEFGRDKGVSIHINLPCPTGKWRGRYDQMLTQENVKEVNELCRQFRVTRDIHTGYEANQCPAGKCFCHVTPYGDVMPCSFVPIIFGNVLHNRLMDIVGRIHHSFDSVGPGYCPAAEDEGFARKYLSMAGQSDSGELPRRF